MSLGVTPRPPGGSGLGAEAALEAVELGPLLQVGLGGWVHPPRSSSVYWPPRPCWAPRQALGRWGVKWSAWKRIFHFSAPVPPTESIASLWYHLVRAWCPVNRRTATLGFPEAWEGWSGGRGVASRACGRPHECSGRSGMVLEPRGLEEAAGPGRWVVPWEPWTPSHVGPEDGKPARTAGAGVCSRPFLDVLVFSKPGIVLVSLKCIREHWACWLLQGANLLEEAFVSSGNQSTISMRTELLDPHDLKSWSVFLCNQENLLPGTVAGYHVLPQGCSCVWRCTHTHTPLCVFQELPYLCKYIDVSHGQRSLAGHGS